MVFAIEADELPIDFSDPSAGGIAGERGVMGEVAGQRIALEAFTSYRCRQGYGRDAACGRSWRATWGRNRRSARVGCCDAPGLGAAGPDDDERFAGAAFLERRLAAVIGEEDEDCIVA